MSFDNENQKAMMTLNDARKIQKQNETRSLTAFLISFTIIGLLTAIMFSFTDVLEHSAFYLTIPITAMLAAIMLTGIYKFLSKKEFTGRVVHVHIYSIRERRRKGINWGTGAGAMPRRQEAEIIAEDPEGKSVMLTVKHQDTVSKLSVGDKIAVLRFVETPVIIEDTGKERSY